MIKDQYKYRNELLRKYIYLGFFISFGLAPIYYYIGIIYLAITLNIFTISMGYLILSTKNTDRYIQNSRTFMLSITILFISGFINGNQEVDSKYFLLLYPIASFSIIGAKEGIFWSFIIILAFIGIYIHIPHIYNFYSFIFFIVAFFMVSFLTYYYRYYEMLNFEYINEVQYKKDQILFQQAKLVNMGEMVGAITHQWRQPLSEISSNIMLIQVEHDYKEKVDIKNIHSAIENTNKLLIMMSKTLDTFKSVYKMDASSENFFLNQAISDTITIFKSVVLDIEINMNYNKNNSYSLFGVKEDIINIFLILFKNSKDAFVENKIKQRKIDIYLNKKIDYIEVKYQDNAGGIKLNPISKVFELSKSTKKDRGMGMGLYIVKKLINERYNGKISVENRESGSEFTLIFKL